MNFRLRLHVHFRVQARRIEQIKHRAQNIILHVAKDDFALRHLNAAFDARLRRLALNAQRVRANFNIGEFIFEANIFRRFDDDIEQQRAFRLLLAAGQHKGNIAVFVPNHRFQIKFFRVERLIHHDFARDALLAERPGHADARRHRERKRIHHIFHGDVIAGQFDREIFQRRSRQRDFARCFERSFADVPAEPDDFDVLARKRNFPIQAGHWVGVIAVFHRAVREFQQAVNFRLRERAMHAANHLRPACQRGNSGRIRQKRRDAAQINNAVEIEVEIPLKIQKSLREEAKFLPAHFQRIDRKFFFRHDKINRAAVLELLAVHVKPQFAQFHVRRRLAQAVQAAGGRDGAGDDTGHVFPFHDDRQNLLDGGLPHG